MASVHPLSGKELRALRKLQRETPSGLRAVHVFVSERLAPLSVAGYQRMVARAGHAAGFPFLVHSHMLRHSSKGRNSAARIPARLIGSSYPPCWVHRTLPSDKDRQVAFGRPVASPDQARRFRIIARKSDGRVRL
jgi:integrase